MNTESDIERIADHLGVRAELPDVILAINTLKKNAVAGAEIREAVKLTLAKAVSVVPFGSHFDPPAAWEARLELRGLSVTLLRYDVMERTEQASRFAKREAENYARMFVEQFTDALRKE